MLQFSSSSYLSFPKECPRARVLRVMVMPRIIVAISYCVKCIGKCYLLPLSILMRFPHVGGAQRAAAPLFPQAAKLPSTQAAEPARDGRRRAGRPYPESPRAAAPTAEAATDNITGAQTPPLALVQTERWPAACMRTGTSPGPIAAACYMA